MLKCFDLTWIFKELESLKVSKRGLNLGKEENVQLKKIEYDKKEKRCFLSLKKTLLMHLLKIK